MVNRSKTDIGVQPFTVNEVSTKIVDFSFPYKLYNATVLTRSAEFLFVNTFVTRRTEYKPQIFGIFQTFLLQLWIAIFSILIAMSLVHYIIFTRMHSFDKILLQVFAVLLR